MRNILVPAGLLVLGACSGGGGGGSGGGGSTPTPLPTLTVTLDRTSQAAEATDEVPAALTFNANYTGTATGSVVPNVQLDSGVVLDGQIAASGTSYTVKLKSAPNLALGERKGEATFRLCRDANCSEVYPGSTQKFTYTLTSRLADWTTLQRNNAHNGYVRATFDPAKFRQAWQVEIDQLGMVVRSLAISKDTVFISGFNEQSETAHLVASNLRNGQERWRRSFSNNYHRLGAPSYSPTTDSVVIAGADQINTGGAKGKLYTMRADDGQILVSRDYGAQYPDIAPTLIDGKAYVASLESVNNRYGNFIYGFDILNAAAQWSLDLSKELILGEAALGSDGEYLYYFHRGMNVIRPTDGALVRSVAAPSGEYEYYHPGAPIVGSRKSVISQDMNQGGVIDIPFISFDPEAGRVNWRTDAKYQRDGALAKGVLYAGTGKGRGISAIDESSGKVLWSLDGEDMGVGGFIGNIVVSENLMFVKTSDKVVAISLAAPRAIVWSAPVKWPLSLGPIAIAPDGKLLVVTSIRDSDAFYGKTMLTAFDLL